MNSLRIIRAHIKLGQRKLARVQVFQLTGHRSCTGLQMAKMPSLYILTQAGLRLNCRKHLSGQALQFRFNVDDTRHTCGLGANYFATRLRLPYCNADHSVPLAEGR